MKRSNDPTRAALVLLAAGALWTAACGGGSTSGEPSPQAPEIVEAAAEPAASAETPTSAEPAEGPDTAMTEKERELALRERELEIKEREIALQEAELAARERAAREAERERRAAAPRPAAPAAPAPEPRSEPERTAAAEPPPPPPPVEPEPEEVYVLVPAGTELDVEFLSRLASDLSAPGESFRTRVIEPVYAEGLPAIPAGAEIVGRVVEAAPVDKKVGGRSRLTLEFTDLVLPSGTTAPIAASFAERGKSETKRDAATIGGAAAAGAILGRILERDDKSKGTLIGAIVGAAAGTAAAVKTQGEEVEIPVGAVLRLRLSDPVEVSVPR